MNATRLLAHYDRIANAPDAIVALFPLPPLAEQHRIVAKADELMAICDRLEATIAAARDTRRRLLDALLAEALGQDAAPVREAAE